MKHILSRRNVEVLRQFAWSKVLLALDYDGTLAPIVNDPQKAHMRSRTRDLLAEVARLYPCAVISGRAQQDVLRRLRGVGVIEAIGNHGLEPSKYAGPLMGKVRRWLPVLEAGLRGLKGVVIEDKVFSLAVHYRLSREKRKAREAIREAAASLSDVRTIGGKMVVNLVPEGAPHKGMALRGARARFQCDTAIYVGDDDTDEDVFGLDEPGRLLGIRVEKSEDSRAEYFIEGQAEMDDLLEVLRSCRRSTGKEPTPSDDSRAA
jgi:trehalose 6-phosphate phosphatase